MYAIYLSSNGKTWAYAGMWTLAESEHIGQRLRSRWFVRAVYYAGATEVEAETVIEEPLRMAA